MSTDTDSRAIYDARSEFADRFQIARFRGFMDRVNVCSGLAVEMRCLYNITRSSLSCSWLPIIQCGFCLQSIPDHLRFVKRFFAKNWPRDPTAYTSFSRKSLVQQLE